MSLQGYSFDFLKSQKTIGDLQKLKALDIPENKTDTPTAENFHKEEQESSSNYAEKLLEELQ